MIKMQQYAHKGPVSLEEGVASILCDLGWHTGCQLFYLVSSSVASVMSCVQQMLDAMVTSVAYSDEVFR